MEDRPANTLLRAEGITKRFPGVVALRGVNLDLRHGEIHALCGENGAGKSTLIKVLSGVHPHGSYEGVITLDGAPLRLRTTRDAEERGIAVIHQELMLVPGMTVAENIFLGKEPTHNGLVDRLTMYDTSQRLLRRFDIAIDPETPVRDLGVGQQQLVEIVKALAKESRLLILDEPTAALSRAEVDALLGILMDLRRQGVTCVYVSHKLDEVFAIADRITVLRDGESIVTLDTAATSRAEVIRNMVGREITEMFPRAASSPGDVRLSVRDLEVAPPDSGTLHLRGISFDVRAGEVLGIGGLMGAGRSELLMHLLGLWGHRTNGRVEVDRRPYNGASPAEAIRNGLVLVSEDRKRYGLIPDKTVGFNLSLSSLQRLTVRGLIDTPREWTRNREFFDSLGLRAPGLNTSVSSLSGGNQQKVVLGKALMTDPRVVLLDEPTRGIDVGAKQEVYHLINRLTAAGRAVVLVSSELPELMGMSDRILMLHEGAVGGVFGRAEATQEALLAAAMGQAFERDAPNEGIRQ
jgi:D-xylose transport system ATP-binding protein